MFFIKFGYDLLIYFVQIIHTFAKNMMKIHKRSFTDFKKIACKNLN